MSNYQYPISNEISNVQKSVTVGNLNISLGIGDWVFEIFKDQHFWINVFILKNILLKRLDLTT